MSLRSRRDALRCADKVSAEWKKYEDNDHLASLENVRAACDRGDASVAGESRRSLTSTRSPTRAGLPLLGNSATPRATWRSFSFEERHVAREHARIRELGQPRPERPAIEPTESLADLVVSNRVQLA